MAARQRRSLAAPARARRRGRGPQNALRLGSRAVTTSETSLRTSTGERVPAAYAEQLGGGQAPRGVGHDVRHPPPLRPRGLASTLARVDDGHRLSPVGAMLDPCASTNCPGTGPSDRSPTPTSSRGWSTSSRPSSRGPRARPTCHCRCVRSRRAARHDDEHRPPGAADDRVGRRASPSSHCWGPAGPWSSEVRTSKPQSRPRLGRYPDALRAQGNATASSPRRDVPLPQAAARSPSRRQHRDIVQRRDRHGVQRETRRATGTSKAARRSRSRGVGVARPGRAITMTTSCTSWRETSVSSRRTPSRTSPTPTRRGSSGRQIGWSRWRLGWHSSR